MTSRCDVEALEALVRGELDGARASDVRAHAAICASCKRELEWLRAEQALIARRTHEDEPVPAGLWRGIQARIAIAPRRAMRAAWVGGAIAAAAAAATVLVLLRTEPPQQPRPQPTAKHRKLDPKTAIDNAEKEYQQAISVMETEVRRKRPDVQLDVWNQKVAAARAAAAGDPDARLAVLDGYATYMHSLLDLEEKRR